jgi:hypothetical protein
LPDEDEGQGAPMQPAAAPVPRAQAVESRDPSTPHWKTAISTRLISAAVRVPSPTIPASASASSNTTNAARRWSPPPRCWRRKDFDVDFGSAHDDARVDGNRTSFPRSVEPSGCALRRRRDERRDRSGRVGRDAGACGRCVARPPILGFYSCRGDSPLHVPLAERHRNADRTKHGSFDIE